ncbi:helix-turn-helix domain-containing protein [Thiorhodococcus minor]|uniref:Helix-turn-helix transcriptional regulator n=1 Tax=Thiorhodococcus minor TaxID=57489 RepID=A0A6M0K8D4_9GAMM|nr:helix-turn-helix transcriptional regulator [Thiorhodococcus minor]NEV64675.1 helix-turn-helix transcriptional regulator [Thiorhodococcus minor]
MSLGKNIRRLRQDKGWSQAHLSEQTGIKIGHISTLEKDDGNPTLATLYKLMEALDCSPDSLLLDVSKMNRDAILKQTLERALKLPEANKAAIIEVVDGYCRACGMEQNFAPGNKSWLAVYLKAPERIPMVEAEEGKE